MYTNQSNSFSYCVKVNPLEHLSIFFLFYIHVYKVETHLYRIILNRLRNPIVKIFMRFTNKSSYKYYF